MRKALCLSVAVLAVNIANAQSDKVSQDESKALNEVVVSGQNGSYTEKQVSSSLRLNTPILETPQNIQIVTKTMLKDQQVISMSDGLIRNVSGLVRMEHWGDMYTNITARGSQIQAMRNGMNVVNSYWGPLTEDMSFVDNIEFVKGPAGLCCPTATQADCIMWLPKNQPALPKAKQQ